MTNCVRGARAFAPLVIVALAAGCSSGPGAKRAASSAPAVSSSASADAPATAAVQRAKSVLAAVKSYRFDAAQTITGTHPVTTREIGSVVRAQGVAYTLTVGRARTQTIRLRTATYVRALPGRWSLARQPRPVADPTQTLAQVLDGIVDLRSTAGSGVVGQLPATVATAIGVPTTAAPVQVTLTFDVAGHVTLLLLRTTTSVHGRAIPVSLVTTYSSFDRVPALHAPA